MPINSTHPQYCTNKADLTDDAYKGNIIDYVPMLSGQTTEEYNKYRARGSYFNVTRRTTEAIIGAIMRKPYKISDVNVTTDENIGLGDFIAECIRGILLEGRIGVFCDYNDTYETPYLTLYKHKCIKNWRYNSDYKLSLVVLEEYICVPDPQDPYETIEVEQYRELMLDENGFFVVRLWQEDGNKKDKYKVVDVIEPTIRGSRIDYIPFTFANAFDNTPYVHDPVCYNLAQLNISHFISTVDLEHGVHFTALPQPYLAGSFATKREGAISIGTPTIWELDFNSQIGYLEFSGSGLKAVENRIQAKEQQMFELGSSMLFTKGVESADAMAIRYGAVTATLVSITMSVESMIQKSLYYANLWNGVREEPMFEMNKDFSPTKMTAQDLSALTSLYSTGIISKESFLECLVQGEIIPSVQVEMERQGNNYSTIINSD